jgi:hypothetical protein
MSDIGDKARKWQKEYDRINKNPSLTVAEKKSVDDLGKKLFISDLSSAFLKAMKTKTPQRVSYLEDDKTGELLEEMTIEGSLIPEFDLSRRNVQLVVSFDRLKPETVVSPLLRTVFTQAGAIQSYANKPNVDQEELQIISNSILNDKKGRTILPLSPLAAVQGLVNIQTSEWSDPPSDKNTYFLNRHTKLIK